MNDGNETELWSRTRRGFVVASRPGVGGRSQPFAEGGSFDIIDLAPTIGALLGVDWPETVGEPLSVTS
ncbi:MAG TPA: hypothetical protein DCR14_07185 [Acidimicrobiaceae bacterium]|nr:hypothetical protein [Acidimicrobiaceae bacterium]